MISFIILIIVAIGLIIACFSSKKNHWIGDTIMSIGMFGLCMHAFYGGYFILAILAFLLMFGDLMLAHTHYHNRNIN